MKKIKTVKKRILTVLAAALLFASCKKENNEVPVPPVPLISKKLLATNFNGNTTFEYTTDGKLKQLILEKSWGTYRQEFIYEPGKVTMELFNHLNGKKEEKFILTLNQKGYISSTTENQFDANGNAFAFKTANYKYNSSGELIEVSDPGSFVSKYYYDAAGNNVKFEYYNSQNQLQTISYYTFSSLPDKFPLHGRLAPSWLSWFLPAKAKNLIATLKQVNTVTNSTNYEEAISYELDAAGFVKKGMVDELLVGQTDWAWTYTWDK